MVSMLQAALLCRGLFPKGISINVNPKYYKTRNQGTMNEKARWKSGTIFYFFSG